MRHAHRLALVCLALLLPSRGFTHVLEIAPTTIELKPGEPGVVFIANQDRVPMKVQIDAFDWAQHDGQDELTESRRLLVSPPLVSLLPGARATVRILAPRAAAPELTYRLVMSELPSEPAESGNVTVLMRFSIPVFAALPAAAKPELTFDAMTRDGAASVHVRNSGTRTVKLTDLALKLGGSAPDARGMVYVLPGNEAVLALDAANLNPGDAIAITAHDVRSDTNIAATMTVHN